MNDGKTRRPEPAQTILHQQAGKVVGSQAMIKGPAESHWERYPVANYGIKVAVFDLGLFIPESSRNRWNGETISVISRDKVDTEFPKVRHQSNPSKATQTVSRQLYKNWKKIERGSTCRSDINVF